MNKIFYGMIELLFSFISSFSKVYFYFHKSLHNIFLLDTYYFVLTGKKGALTFDILWCFKLKR